MADRLVTLVMTPKEEKALADLLAWVCQHISMSDSHVAANLRQDHSQYFEEIGRINAALNSQR